MGAPDIWPGVVTGRLAFGKSEKYKNSCSDDCDPCYRHPHSGGDAMSQPPSVGPYPTPRRSPRFAFDALVKLVVGPLDNPQQLWSRSTDISQGGIGVNLTAGELKLDELVSLQIPLPEIPLPKQHSVDLRASVRYRVGVHCGFAFLELNEDQQTAIRTACDALARAQPRIRTPPR